MFGTGKIKNFFSSLSNSESVEVMKFEDRRIYHGKKLTKRGDGIFDSMTNEFYAVVTPPRVSIRGQKSSVCYLIDADAGVSVELTNVNPGYQQRYTIEHPEKILIDGKKYSGCRVQVTPAVPEGCYADPQEDIIIDNAREVIIDGQRFAGWTVDLVREAKLLQLATRPEMVGAVISSRMIADYFCTMNRGTKILWLLIGAAIGTFMGLVLF